MYIELCVCMLDICMLLVDADFLGVIIYGCPALKASCEGAGLSGFCLVTTGVLYYIRLTLLCFLLFGTRLVCNTCAFVPETFHKN